MRFNPEDVVFLRNIDLDFGGFGKRSPAVLTSSKRLPLLFYHFSSTFYWADPSTSVCLKTHLSPNLHPDIVSRR